MVCPEEPTKNKMQESLEVFEKVCRFAGQYAVMLAALIFS
jgi:hypothetical protein